MAEVEMTGLSACIAMLSQLEPAQTKAIIVKGVRAGVAVVADAVRANAPVAATAPTKGSTALAQGFLQADITSRVSASTPGAIIGTVAPGKYSKHVATWVARGHRKVAGRHVTAGGQVSGGRSYVRKGKTSGPGSAVGTTTPNDFVDRAFTQSAQQAVTAIEASIVDQLRSKGIVNA